MFSNSIFKGKFHIYKNLCQMQRAGFSHDVANIIFLASLSKFLPSAGLSLNQSRQVFILPGCGIVGDEKASPSEF